MRTNTNCRRLLCLLLLLAGCPSTEPALPPIEPAEPLGKLRVLVVDDASLAGAIRREWSARTGEEIEVAEVSLADFEQGKYEPADCFIYPPAYLGELADEGKIVPLADEASNSATLDRRKILGLVRQYEMRWDEQTYATPLACPRFALLYRSDLFAQLGLSPPATWDEYAKAAQRLGDRSELGDSAPAADAPWSGTAEPWAPRWRSELLMARAASSIRRQGHLSDLFDYVSMEAQLDSPPLLAALNNMQATIVDQPTDWAEIDPAEARRRLLAGECGMAITWLPMPQTSAAETNAPADALPISVAPLPGSNRFYDSTTSSWQPKDEGPASVPLVGFGGRVASVASGSPRKREAFDLITLLAGAEWSTVVGRRSEEAHPFRQEHLKEISRWLPTSTTQSTTNEYRDYLDQLESASLVMVSLRLPGRARYLAALDAAIAKTVSGEETAEVAAAEAGTAWDAITQEIGVTKQRTAFRRSGGG